MEKLGTIGQIEGGKMIKKKDIQGRMPYKRKTVTRK